MERSDLELVMGEQAPRGAATCKQVSGHAESHFALIGEALLWLLISWVAWSIPLTLGLLLISGRFTDAQTGLVLGSSGIVFVLSWVLFIWLVVRGRISRRALVRDGVLVQGALVEVPVGVRPLSGRQSSTTIRFSVNGVERHAVSGAARGEPGSGVPILWTPGARRALTFPNSRKGRAVAANVHRDIVIDRLGNTATIVFTRGATETFFAVISALVVLELSLGLLALPFQRPDQLQCDRANNECVITSHNLFRGVSNVRFHPSELVSSQVGRYGDNDVDWVAKLSGGRQIQVGARTGSPGQARIYEQRSRELAGFIADGAQPQLAMSYPAFGTINPPVLFFTMLVFLWIVLAWANAWRATLSIDSVAGTLTITRKPALLPPARRTVPFASIARTDARSGILFLFYAAMPTLRLRLYDDKGRQLFGRWQISSRNAADEIKTVLDVLPRK